MKTFLGFILCFFALSFFVGSLSTHPNDAAPTAAISEPPQAAWNYVSQSDPMGRGIVKTASTDSVNSVDFDFPYEGGSTGEITLRSSPEYGKDAILSVTKGQFMCGLEDCRVNIRIDEGAPFSMHGDQAGDGSSNVIFLPYSPMVRYLRVAKVLRVEATFYDQGSRVFEFHPRGLDMTRLQR